MKNMKIFLKEFITFIYLNIGTVIQLVAPSVLAFFLSFCVIQSCIPAMKVTANSLNKFKTPEYSVNLTKIDLDYINPELSISNIRNNEINKIDKPVETNIYRYKMTDSEFEEFVRVVEAEVTGPEGTVYGCKTYDDVFNSKLHVAQVILNRIESGKFPNTPHEVIFQKNAFSPILDGRYYDVEINQITIDACKEALLLSTADTTYGCEFFIAGSNTCKYGDYIFTDAAGHSFFKANY